MSSLEDLLLSFLKIYFLPLGAKCNLILESHWASTRPAQSHPSISFVQYSLKDRWSSSYKIRKRNLIFRPLYDSMDENKKFKNLIPYHILEYHLSTIWNLNGVQVTSLIRQKTSFFHPNMTPGGKMKIPNHYCKSSRHAQ